MQWKVVIIGSGNVAAVLARQIKAAGHIILQIAARHELPLKSLAYELDTAYSIGFEDIVSGGDLYIIAVSDHALTNVKEWLKISGDLVVHTAGSVPAAILKDIAKHYGILYPFQSIRADRKEIPEIPFLINGSDEHTIARLEDFALTLTGQVKRADDDTRSKFHIAAVVANNFSNHLFTLAQDFCNREGLDFSFLQPLLYETVARLKQYDPGNMQTGPAVRGDEVIVKKHLDNLEPYPNLQEVYREMTKSIQNWYETGKEKDVNF